MPTTIDSSGVTFNDASTITSANTFIAKPASPSNGQVLGYNGSTWTGTSLSASPTSAKAWVNFDGTTSPGTIASAYNVSSVTRNATGNFTVNFTTAMVDANYAMAGSCSSGTGLSINPSTSTVNNLIISTYNSAGSPQNFVENNLIIFGN